MRKSDKLKKRTGGPERSGGTGHPERIRGAEKTILKHITSSKLDNLPYVDFRTDLWYHKTTMKENNDALKLNQTVTSLLVFMEEYNKSIPASFPRASVNILKQFQALHPILFRNSDQWSIDRHRKRVMDWLPSFCGIV